jgi:uncharacterized protein (DUF1800 family)
MEDKDFIKTKHLYARAGFGLHYNQLKKLSRQSINKSVEGLFSASKKNLPIVFVKNEPLQKEYGQLTPEEKRERQKLERQQTRDLNIIFLNRLSNDEAVLREKMTLFWHGHFACRSPQNPYAIQELNNVHRTHALGNFKTLTTEVSKTKAMLSFLNNQQNRKGKPNENFARELMELFTLGRGHYTEEDIKASARAFTGWMYNKEGNFEFREKLHDDGSKTFFGKTGNFNGDDIINMIFEKKQTAYYISEKLYRFFVNDTPNAAHIKELGDELYKKDYEIEPLLRKMFTSGWFYAPENMGNKVKSPIEFIAGLNRQFYIDYAEPGVLIRFQQALGQMLFYPPNVAGWAGGKNYIDSSSLMLRLKIPSTVINNGIIEFEGKADPDDEAFIALSKKQSKQVAQRIKATVNWDKFSDQIPEAINKEQLASFLLQPKVSKTLLDNISNSESLKTKVVQILSTPEYQLC